MALTNDERILVESIKTMLNQDSKLGLSIHDPDSAESKQDWRGTEYLHQQIDDLFQVKAAEFTHAESICQAFSKVHSYRYVDDPLFIKAFDKEMTATAVPANERMKAIGSIYEVISEIATEGEFWAERDSGFNPNLDEIRATTKIEQPTKFDIQNRRINKRNIDKPKHGDGSPAKTTMTNPPLPKDGYDGELEDTDEITYD